MAKPRPRWDGVFQFHGLASFHESRRGPSAVLVLIAAEETRSSADGQHAQVAPRANAPRARPRPAFCCWYRLQSAGKVPLHGSPAGRRIARTDSDFLSVSAAIRTRNDSKPSNFAGCSGSHRKLRLNPRMPIVSAESRPSASKPVTKLSIVLAFASVYFFWGSTYTAIRIGAAEMPALLLAGTRFLIAGAILLAWCRLARSAVGLSREDNADARRDRADASGWRQCRPGLCGRDTPQRPVFAHPCRDSVVCCIDRDVSSRWRTNAAGADGSAWLSDSRAWPRCSGRHCTPASQAIARACWPSSLC